MLEKLFEINHLQKEPFQFWEVETLHKIVREGRGMSEVLPYLTALVDVPEGGRVTSWIGCVGNECVDLVIHGSGRVSLTHVRPLGMETELTAALLERHGVGARVMLVNDAIPGSWVGDSLMHALEQSGLDVVDKTGKLHEVRITTLRVTNLGEAAVGVELLPVNAAPWRQPLVLEW